MPIQLQFNGPTEVVAKDPGELRSQVDEGEMSGATANERATRWGEAGIRR